LSAETRQRTTYDRAISDLLDELNPVIGLIARDHAHHFGAEVLEMGQDIAEAAHAKAIAIATAQGTRPLLSDARLWNLCQRGATWWVQNPLAARYRKRPHTKYSPEVAAKGRERSLARRQQDATRRAYFAQDWAAKGLSLARIAGRLGVTVRTVRNLLSRYVSPWFGMAGKFGKDSVSYPYRNCQGTDTERIPDFPVDDCERNFPDTIPRDGRKNAAQRCLDSEVDRLGEMIPELLREHWQKSAQESS